MHPHINKLYQIADKPSRLIIGLMSGTSIDGLDLALCKIGDNGMDTQIELLEFETISYDKQFRKQIKTISSTKLVELEQVCIMHPLVAEKHASIILECLDRWSVRPDEVDLIASHGQTIYHSPKSLHQNPDWPDATLQIGDADHMACRTGIITVSDFRQKHIASGGEGAPLAVYGDYLIFSSTAENRIMLNMGGIANFTFLPKTLDATAVFSTDVGPGNTMMDAYVQKYFPSLDFDENAQIATAGSPHPGLLNELKQHSFFTKSFPKTTGPELFNLSYLKTAQTRTGTDQLSHSDTLCTLNHFSADMIVQALQTCLKKDEAYTVYASGGGIHNPLLMENIHKQLPNIEIRTTEALAIHPDAKEAVLFAVLANECMVGGKVNFGNPEFGIPSVTMGKISFPD